MRAPLHLRDYAGRAVTQARQPAPGRSWIRCDDVTMLPNGRDALRSLVEMDRALPAADRGRWRLGWQILVVSSLERLDFRGFPTWQYHLSVSCFGHRASAQVCKRVLGDFDLARAEEDNHEAGVHRNFWRAVDLAPDAGVECECKGDETTVVEPDGHTWQRPRGLKLAGQFDENRKFGVAGPARGAAGLSASSPGHPLIEDPWTPRR